MIFPLCLHLHILFSCLDQFDHDQKKTGFLDAHPADWGDDRMVGDVVLMDTDANGNPTVVGVETVFGLFDWKMQRTLIFFKIKMCRMGF